MTMTATTTAGATHRATDEQRPAAPADGGAEATRTATDGCIAGRPLQRRAAELAEPEPRRGGRGGAGRGAAPGGDHHRRDAAQFSRGGGGSVQHLKPGIEITDGKPRMSSIPCDAYSDWSTHNYWSYVEIRVHSLPNHSIVVEAWGDPDPL